MSGGTLAEKHRGRWWLHRSCGYWASLCFDITFTNMDLRAQLPSSPEMWRDLFHLHPAVRTGYHHHFPKKKVRLLTNGGMPSIALGHPSPYSEIQTSIGIFLPSFGDDWCFCQFFMIYGNAASNLHPHGQAAMGWKLNLEGFLQSKGRVRRPPIPDGQECEVVRNAKNKQWRLWNLLPASDDIHICVHTQMYD